MSKPRDPVVHEFHDSLKQSHFASTLPFWEECYRQVFPTMQAMLYHPKDGDHQRLGVDRSIVLTSSKQILVDEKTRWRNKKTGRVYDDIALEEWSDLHRKAPGWVCKSLLCDYIAYAIVPLGKFYLLPTLQLQLAWEKNRDLWTDRYPIIDALNYSNGRSYTTRSWGIPVAVLFREIGACLRATFPPMEEPGAENPGIDFRPAPAPPPAPGLRLPAPPAPRKKKADFEQQDLFS